jgi:hypothetical protein
MLRFTFVRYARPDSFGMNGAVYSRFRQCSSAPQEELMATTRTPGITVLADGRRFIDKRFLGVRIGVRVGAVTRMAATAAIGAAFTIFGRPT